MKTIIFIAGVYGVGKSTICNEISKEFDIASYSASDFISSVSGEKYGTKKEASNSNSNQEILIGQVNSIIDDTFIINGHFCLKSGDNNIITISEDVFEQMKISGILLLEADINTIEKNLFQRDNKVYDKKFLQKLLVRERTQAKLVSEKLYIPLKMYQMNFDGNDNNNIYQIMRKFRV